MKWLALITAGLFAVLASYSQAKYGDAWEKPASYSLAEVEAVNKLADVGMAIKIQPQHDCGLDMNCLLAWAQEKHQRRKKP
jgi:hypothetical protein